MSDLREHVTVHTAAADLDGYLFVGLKGFPALRVTGGAYHECGYYDTTNFPAAWSVSSPTCGDLYMAWQEIDAIRARLFALHRDAEADTDPEPEDSLTADTRALSRKGRR